MSDRTTTTDEQVTPTATITSEVNQTAAGAWRGSVKVSVTAPITFDGFVDHNRATIQAQKEIDGMHADVTWEPVDIQVRDYADASCALDEEPSVLITVPTQEETEIRNAVERLLLTASLNVKAVVDQFNGEKEDTTVTVKGKGK